MKDALGHGSEARGSGRAAPVHSAFSIQKLNPKLAGTPWQTVMKLRNRATAERIAQHMRTDDRRMTNRVK